MGGFLIQTERVDGHNKIVRIEPFSKPGRCLSLIETAEPNALKVAFAYNNGAAKLRVFEKWRALGPKDIHYLERKAGRKLKVIASDSDIGPRLEHSSGFGHPMSIDEALD